MDQDASALLRAVKEHHDRQESGEPLSEGALVWEERLGVPGVDLYRITRCGREMLEAS